MAVVDINWNPSPTQLRIFSLVQIAFFGLVSFSLYRHGFGVTPAMVLMSVSGAITVVGLASPKIVRWVYVAWMAALFPVSWVVSHLLMGCLYYGFVTPIGIIMRLCGYDPMQRKFDKSEATYWKPKSPNTDKSRYFKQY